MLGREWWQRQRDDDGRVGPTLDSPGSASGCWVKVKRWVRGMRKEHHHLIIPLCIERWGREIFQKSNIDQHCQFYPPLYNPYVCYVFCMRVCHPPPFVISLCPSPSHSPKLFFFFKYIYLFIYIFQFKPVRSRCIVHIPCSRAFHRQINKYIYM